MRHRDPIGPAFSFHTKPILFNRALCLADILFFLLRCVETHHPSFVLSFAMEGRYATVSLTLPEFQKVFKAIVPTILDPIPDKAHPVEASLAFYR